MATYPLLTAGLTDRRLERFEQAASTALAAVAAKQIANPVFIDIKTAINNQLETAFHQHTLALLAPHGTLSHADRDAESAIYGSIPALHTLPGLIKRIDAIKTDLPIKAAALAVLREATPLADAIRTLKDNDMVVKRQPKPVEDRRAKYNAPGASKTAIGRVKALLEQITENARAELVQVYTRRATGWLNRFLAAQQAANAEGKRLSVYDLYGSRRSPQWNPEARDFVEQVTQSKATGRPVAGCLQVVTKKANAEAQITAYAEKTATEIQEHFVYKNLAKLDSIVDAKADLVGAEIISREVSLLGLRGTLRFTFADGAAFTAQNAVVESRSLHNKAFLRFPLTFHDVVMAGGVKMGRPSEERMNTVFVGREPTAGAAA